MSRAAENDRGTANAVGPMVSVTEAMDLARLVIALIGTALIGYGAWLAWPPAGFMATGILLVALAIIAALRSGR